MAKSCTIPDCTGKHLAKGLCKKHYLRLARHGDPTIVHARGFQGSAEDRFWPKVDKDGPIPENAPELGPCWIWTASTKDGGYGQFKMNGRMTGAHIAAYVLVVGPVPEGLELDHLCHTLDPECLDFDACPHHRCVNPAHLDPVDHLTNVQRGNSGIGMRTKTHCPQGHEYTPENTYSPPGGRSRACRECRRLRRPAQARTRTLSA